MARRIVLSIVIVLLATITWGAIFIWRSPAYYALETACEDDPRVLTMEQYGEVIGDHARPFVVATEAALVFGAEHTRNSDHPQIETLRARWREFQPTVALVEGRLGFLIPGFMDPVETFGEGGAVGALARRHGAAIYTWDLPKSELILKLVERFSSEQVAVHQILTPYFSNLRFGRPEDPEAFVGGYLDRGWYPGLDGAVTTIEGIDRIWHRDFAIAPDWRDTSDEYGLPGYLAEISDAGNLIRNRHLVCVVRELIASGERVFVVCGSSHAVCVSSALANDRSG